jgi:small-conductance mechanosensitive channel
VVERVVRDANGRILIGPMLLAASGFAAYGLMPRISASLGLAPDSGGALVLEQLSGILAWLATAWACARLLDVLMHRAAVVSQRTAPYPRLLTDLLRVLLFATAFVAVLLTVFHRPATGLIATSSVLIAVTGFALRNIIADLFSGIALGVEHPYRIGDWIETAGGTVGKVVEMNWRATRLRARNGTSIVVPNGLIAGTRLLNFSRAQPAYRATLRVPLDAAVPAERAKRILLAAALDAERGFPGLNPDVVLHDYEAGAAIYLVRFVMTDYDREVACRDAVAGCVLQALRRSGLALARPGQELRLSRAERASAHPRREALLRHIDLFHAFDAQERSELAQHLGERSFARDAVIVRRGEAGDSLYILAEGVLDVRTLRADAEAGGEVRLDRLLPGDVFGEMSLLTGQPRSATVVAATDCVVYEMRKSLLDPILERRPELAERLATLMAERQARNARRLQAPDPPAPSPPPTREDLLRRLKTFFNLP